MPRPPRADEAGAIYHALNRGNAKQTLFRKEDDYHAFERILVDALRDFPVDLLAYQWMPNHWHMVLRPRENGAMSRMLQWAAMTHAARHHAHYQTVGNGHIYQGRFKSFPVQTDDHFFVVCRYVERNALAAGLVSRAEDWKWGSLWNWNSGSSRMKLAEWPLPRQPNWIERVNCPLNEREEKQLKQAIARGRPFGDAGWIETTARRLDLESTLRNRGRPRKFPQASQ